MSKLKVRWDNVAIYIIGASVGYFFGVFIGAPYVMTTIFGLLCAFAWAMVPPVENLDVHEFEELCPCGCGDTLEVVEMRILKGSWEVERKTAEAATERSVE